MALFGKSDHRRGEFDRPSGAAEQIIARAIEASTAVRNGAVLQPDKAYSRLITLGDFEPVWNADWLLKPGHQMPRGALRL
jgi:hypothetical protein